MKAERCPRAAGQRRLLANDVITLRPDHPCSAAFATRHAARSNAQAQLLEKQKEGKKKMRKFGKVEIPQAAFIAVKMDG